jgi:hypothetical protein
MIIPTTALIPVRILASRVMPATDLKSALVVNAAAEGQGYLRQAI